MGRHVLALAAAGWLLAGGRAAAQSAGDDHWFFGAIEWCNARGAVSGRTYVERVGSGLDFLVVAGGNESGEPQFPAAFVVPLQGDDCGAATHAQSPADAPLYLHYLNAGFRVAPAAVHECQTERVRDCDPVDRRTVVLARSLSEPAIVDAIMNRRVYTSTDENLRVLFSINGHPLGSVVPMTPGTPLRIEVRLADPDEPAAPFWVSLRHDEVGGPLEADRELSGTALTGDGTIVFTQFRRAARDEYYLLQVRQGRGAESNVVWTAPIWLVAQ